MPTIEKRKKALSINPLKSSQPLGASLAFLGFQRAVPMLHGSQGCTAFGKVFFVRHFREPIPLQTTAMDQVSTVMGAGDNVVEGLKTLASKNAPGLIGLASTGLSETQGSDMDMAVREFRSKHPEYADVPVVPVSTPDFSGCLETGYAKAVEKVIETLVPDPERAGTRPGARKKQVNLLASSMLTPGDLEEIKDMVESFGLRPLVLPDISDSLDGRLTEDNFSPLTVGGTPVNELQTIGDAAATLVIGPSLSKAADLLREITGVPDYRFDHLFGLDAVDAFINALHTISGVEVPERLERQRAQLQDAMLDGHFMLGMAKLGVAGDPDLVNAFSQFLAGMGAETTIAVVAANGQAVARINSERIKIGDLGDFETMAKEHGLDMMIGNSHCTQVAERLALPLLKAGFPLYDELGLYQRVWVGYRGSKQMLFDLANRILSLHKGEIAPYRSIYVQQFDEAAA